MLSLVNVRMIDGICVELKNATSKWFSKTNVWSEGWPVFLELDGGDPYLYEPGVSLDVSYAVFHIRFRKFKKINAGSRSGYFSRGSDPVFFWFGSGSGQSYSGSATQLIILPLDQILKNFSARFGRIWIIQS